MHPRREKHDEVQPCHHPPPWCRRVRHHQRTRAGPAHLRVRHRGALRLRACLEQCGVDVTVLPALEQFPDSCFVEDPPSSPLRRHHHQPRAASRNGEKGRDRTPWSVASSTTSTSHIVAPGTLDGGDVMMVGDHSTWAAPPAPTKRHPPNSARSWPVGA